MFVLFALIYGLDQIRSDGFRCRNLKDGTGLLLSNETQPAEYLNKTFSQICEISYENGEYVDWYYDAVNGHLSDYMIYDFNDDVKSSQKFSKTADLIESFNLVGFHEVCNVLTEADVDSMHFMPPWFGTRNATGSFFKISL